MMRSSGRTLRRFAGAALAASIGLGLGGFSGVESSARAADHRDGPRTTNNAATLGGLDINDVYIFTSPANKNNTVMVMSVGGAAVGILSPPHFTPGSIYEFRVSNDGDPTADEIVLQVLFSDPDPFLRQSYVVYALDGHTGKGVPVASGVTGKNVAIKGGGTIRAAIQDDPFFFDLIAFNEFKHQVDIGASVGARVAPFLPPKIPNNFFGNFNVLAIVVEVPRLRLQSTAANPNISVYARTLLPGGAQYDRMGRPAINTVVGFASTFYGKPNIQDFINSVNPGQDASLRGEAAQRINLYFGLPIAKATALVNMLLPDVLTFNTTDSSGFLNGRRLEDDVIDAELSLLTDGGLKGDRVISDSVFSKTFPYLGAPLPRAASKGASMSITKLQNQQEKHDIKIQAIQESLNSAP